MKKFLGRASLEDVLEALLIQYKYDRTCKQLQACPVLSKLEKKTRQKTKRWISATGRIKTFIKKRDQKYKTK